MATPTILIDNVTIYVNPQNQIAVGNINSVLITPLGGSQAYSLSSLAALILSAPTFDLNGFLVLSNAESITATGTNQSTATALTKQLNAVTSVPAANAGVSLFSSMSVGSFQRIFHADFTSGNTLYVWPPVGHNIMNLAANLAVAMVAGQANDFHYAGNGLWLIK